MKHFRINSQRLLQLAWLLAGVALPAGNVDAAPTPETRTALFAAG